MVRALTTIRSRTQSVGTIEESTGFSTDDLLTRPVPFVFQTEEIELPCRAGRAEFCHGRFRV
jgi:hypothetical protein